MIKYANRLFPRRTSDEITEPSAPAKEVLNFDGHISGPATSSGHYETLGLFLATLMLVFASVTSLAADNPNRPSDLRLNDLQYIGTHNSYHIEPDHAIFQLLQKTRYKEGKKWGWQALSRALVYTHPPLEAQLQLGLRNFELDIYVDTEGGRYANPGGLLAAEQSGYELVAPFDPEGLLKQPGFKTFHVTDFDVRSTCLLFKDCLKKIKKWSDHNPRHVPVILLIEAKTRGQEPITNDYKPAVPELFTSKTWTAFEEEILSIFPRKQLITPDSVRGSHITLREAIKEQGWPLVSDLLGKVMFVLMHEGPPTEAYVSDNPNLEGKLMFVNLPSKHPSATFVLTTKPHNEEQFRKIQRYARSGYIVYTRGDANTEEARKNSLSRSSYAFLSGAQIVSTDYPYPDYRFSNYKVQFGDGVFVRCNESVAPQKCQSNQ